MPVITIIVLIINHDGWIKYILTFDIREIVGYFIIFFNAKRFGSEIHLEQICLKLRTCTYCSQLKAFRHVCGQDAHWCGNCNKSVDSYHYCYMLKEEESESVKDKFKGYIFFDFEAYKGKSNHVVNLAMA